MLAAMNEITSCTMGVNRAAPEYGVPQMTLKDRISGCITSMGSRLYLNKEEKELVDFDCLY